MPGLLRYHGILFLASTNASSELYEFLRLHAPTKCNVFFGGFLFGTDGSESKQLDVLFDVGQKWSPGGQSDTYRPRGLRNGDRCMYERRFDIQKRIREVRP